jgi:HK97 family phage major capsid protein
MSGVQEITKSQLNGFLVDALNNLGLQATVEQINERLEKMQESAGDIGAKLAAIEKQTEPTQKETGAQVGRFMRALAAGRGDRFQAASYARNTWGDDYIAKALESGDEAAGGFLVKDEYAAGMIELLRPASVVRSLNPLVVPLDTGTLRMSKMTSGSSGSWIGEGEAVPVTEPGFGQIVLIAKKYGSLVPISNDLLRRSSSQVDMLVRDDLVDDIAQSTDVAFIRSDGTGGTPKGLKEFAGTTINANTTVTIDTVTSELAQCLQALADNNVRFRRPGWIIEPRTWRYLITVRDGNGNLVWKPEMDRGTLMGFPFRMTSQIPRNLGAGSDTEVYFADFADVVLGEATSILLDVSSTAAYQSGANVKAAFSMDQTLIRAIVEVDMQVRHNESVVLIDTVRWGV